MGQEEEEEERKDTARDRKIHRIQRILTVMEKISDRIQDKVDTEGNTNAQAEVEAAQGFLDSAQSNIDEGDYRSALKDLREVRMHLKTIRQML